MDFVNKAARQDYLLKQEIDKEVGGDVEWDSIKGKPTVIAAGATQEAARSAIGAGTSNLTIGTTATTAKAGNYQPPAATTSAAGVVKKMANIADLTEAPTMEDFNALLAAMRAAGLM